MNNQQPRIRQSQPLRRQYPQLSVEEEVMMWEEFELQEWQSQQPPQPLN